MFYPYAKRILELQGEALHALKRYRNSHPHFTVRLPSPRMDDYIQAALTAYYKHYPEAVISLDHIEPEFLCRTSVWKKNTLYIISKDRLPNAPLYTEPIATFSRMCVMPSSHPLASRQSVCMEDLLGSDLYVNHHTLCDPEKMKAMELWPYRDRLHIISTPNAETAFSKIASTGGVCLVPGYMRSYLHLGLSAVPLRDARPITLTAASLEPLTQDMCNFIEYIRMSAADL